MVSRKRCTFWIDEWQDKALKAIKKRDGVPEAEQLRRAITAWVKLKGFPRPITSDDAELGPKGGE